LRVATFYDLPDISFANDVIGKLPCFWRPWAYLIQVQAGLTLSLPSSMACFALQGAWLVIRLALAELQQSHGPHVPVNPFAP
jgi:hypothetical protein